MNPYRVEISRRAVRAVAALEPKDQNRIRAAIDLLADDPRPPGCVALVGEHGVYRVRVGAYRILYEVIDEVIDTRLVIQVIRVGHRRDVYRSR